jgi:diguanylate cyclase (GGDEF)-like protein
MPPRRDARAATPSTPGEAVTRALTAALGARDPYTGTHSAETSELAIRVAERLGVEAGERTTVGQVAALHDVGKIGIPTEVLCKPGPLDRDERALMRQHPVIGQRILAGIPELCAVSDAVRGEHERWDGGGYPDGLAGEQIPLASRIVFACDAWHAMTSDRPYRPAMSRSDALRELRENAGSQFDPDVTAALLEILGEEPEVDEARECATTPVADELQALAAELGAEDLFVFRRVAGGLYSHVGGIGRGAGWAGNIELDSGQEQHLATALRTGAPVSVELEEPGRIVGPYYGRSAMIVPCAAERVVMFASSTRRLVGDIGARTVWLAERIHTLVDDVAPSKRLADELEVLAAVRAVTTISAGTVGETLAAIAASARNALAAEYAAAVTLPSANLERVSGEAVGDWQPPSPATPAEIVEWLTAGREPAPLVSQDVAELLALPAGFAREQGASALLALPIGTPAIAVLLVVHADPGPRGFTTFCRRVARAIAEAAEPVLRRALVEDRLRIENMRLSERVRTDALTGVASRAAWDEALSTEAPQPGGPPLSVVIVDVDGLKAINDELGHAAGDDLLRRCARELANSVGLADLVARVGGDEFGVLLRYADEQQAQAWCARIDRRLRRHGGPELSLSLGYAAVPPNSSLAAAVEAADQMMYARKVSRRVARASRAA